MKLCETMEGGGGRAGTDIVEQSVRNEGLELTLLNDLLQNERLEPTLLNDR
jgi:hypothetical protein